MCGTPQYGQTVRLLYGTAAATKARAMEAIVTPGLRCFTSRTRFLLWLVYGALAGIYLLVCHAARGDAPDDGTDGNRMLRQLTKPLPTLLLIAVVHHKDSEERWSAPRYSAAIVAALVAFACGDELLAMGFFDAGLAAFLVGHCLAIAAFSQPSQLDSNESLVLVAPSRGRDLENVTDSGAYGSATRRNDGAGIVSPVRIGAATAIVAGADATARGGGRPASYSEDLSDTSYSARNPAVGVGAGAYERLPVHMLRLGPFLCSALVFTVFFHQHIHSAAQYWPTVVYACAESAAGWRAAARVGYGASAVQQERDVLIPEGVRLQWCGVIGMCMFMASDAILAFNKFVNPVPGAAVAVMVTYWTAIALLAQSVPVVHRAPL